MMKTFFGGQPARNGNTNHLNALKILLPYLWPQNSTGIKNRVLLAALFLILAKIITVGIPFIYKLAVDEISETLDAIVIVPISILIAYGIARVIAQTFGELRDAVFAKVAQRAVRHAALNPFRFASIIIIFVFSSLLKSLNDLISSFRVFVDSAL